MGAVNYRSSNYITLATRPATAEDLKNDPIFMQFANQEIEEAGAELDGIIDYELYEMEQTDKTIQSLFDELDALHVPFWVQNSTIASVDNWRKYLDEYTYQALERVGVDCSEVSSR